VLAVLIALSPSFLGDEVWGEANITPKATLKPRGMR
jgi:hypothetical protein